VKLLGKVRDRSVRASELFQNAASGGIRERGERSIENGSRILNHVVQYIARIGDMQGAERAALPAAFILSERESKLVPIGNDKVGVISTKAALSNVRVDDDSDRTSLTTHRWICETYAERRERRKEKG
jgi:hypothetical protein